MTNGTFRKSLILTMAFSALLVCALLIVSSQPARADSGDLPPRPTVEVTSSSPVGGFIRLQIAFPDSWSWTARPWQATHTQVQWQTCESDWVNVTGWYGALDDVDVDANGSVTGEKTWWVAPRDLGTGPFRWLVTAGNTGTSLAVSEPFTLPARSTSTVDVAVSLPE
ncbi:MAG: hypothetical protein MUQ30_03525 [Anaerolineae bacterium]|nr:hypothetical protein [Anaerolineae bacterium]